MPWYLLSGRVVFGHYSFRMPIVTTNVIQTAYAIASAVRTSSIRALFLLDAKCQGKCRPDNTSHSICLLENACHGTYAPDNDCQGTIPSRYTVSRQISSRQRLPWHLPSGQGMSGCYSF